MIKKMYFMIQSKRVDELIDIYKQAEKCYEYNHSSSFYKCLKHKLVLAARKYDEKEILEEYKIACQSYLDSNLLEINISIATLLFAFAGLLKVVDIKVTDVANVLVLAVVSVSAVVAAGFMIYMHRRRRKLLEIYHVLEKNNCDREK